MTTITHTAWWPAAIDNLRELVESHGELARARAREYSNEYSTRRGLMVYDVVASRQRNYTRRVRPMVEQLGRAGVSSLADIVTADEGDLGRGLRQGEADTIRTVALGLIRFADERGLNDDDGVHRWAVTVADLEHAQRLDPYVGAVSGIGPALFAYLRMRSGADAIKPDLRVQAALNRLGFEVPGDPHSLLVTTRLAAEAVGVDRLVLDQLLWWRSEPSPVVE